MATDHSLDQESSAKKVNNRLLTIAMILFAVVMAVIIVLFQFSGSIRPRARMIAMVSDGRVIGNAAQKFFLESGKTQVSFAYNTTSGEITGDLTPWIRFIGKGYYISDTTIESGNSAAFSLGHPKIDKVHSVTFTDEGKTTFDPNQP